MDIDSFISKHRPEWSRLEAASARGSRGLARLSGPELSAMVALYTRVASQLAEVQTRYRDPSLESYLNGLVGRARVAVYGTRARSLKGGISLFGSRYRAAVRRSAPFVLVAAAILIGTMLLTYAWVAASPEAREGLVPPFARDAVERAGGGSGVGSIPGPEISTLVLLNNLTVAFLAFALGIGLAAGTVWVLGQNGIFMGMLAGAFHAGGKAAAFWELVLPHGFLEITAICIAGGAGIRMGWSVIDPGDRRRSLAVAETARDSVLVVVGVIPAFAVAALIEGFVTGAAAPAWIKTGAGALVAAGYLLFLFGTPRRYKRP